MQKIDEIILLLGAAFPRQDFPAPTIKLYRKMLSDLDANTLEAAVLDLVARKTFLPSIAEIREAEGLIREKSLGVLDAYSAWEQVLSEMRDVGSYRSPELDELTMRAVDAVGGWRMLCRSENTVADRSRFISAYETFLKRKREDAQTVPQVRALIDQMSVPMLERGGEVEDV